MQSADDVEKAVDRHETETKARKDELRTNSIPYINRTSAATHCEREWCMLVSFMT